MVIKVQFHNIAPEGAILQLPHHSTFMNMDHKLPILGVEGVRNI